ncbi:hypothetical protein ABNQ39_00285 (plasmid) [Azospirillum sp. A26]|uniref:hypothetical protein n=1 Tax=Azospirillum sp. A26 TaxID=3160607 RepID=UPI0036706A22
MAIDRNARARMAARIQAMRGLTHAQRGIARALLMACDQFGRVKATYDRIARLSGAARSTVGAAVQALELVLAGLLQVVRRKADRPGRNGGTVRANAVNLYLWTIPAAAPAHKSEDRPGSTKQDPPMDPALAAALARFGNAIADARDAALTAPPNRATVAAGSGRVWRP